MIQLTDNFEFNSAPIDAKLAPVESYDALKEINNSYRFLGMTVVVTNSGTGETATYLPQTYVLSSSLSNRGWKLQSGFSVPTYAHLSTLAYNAITLGLEAFVVADETDGGKMNKYWVTAIDKSSKTVNWERKTYSTELMIDGDNIEEPEEIVNDNAEMK